jgi:hypothetical protein
MGKTDAADFYPAKLTTAIFKSGNIPAPREPDILVTLGVVDDLLEGVDIRNTGT